MRVFADTHFYVALLGSRDSAHGAAARWQASPEVREVVTTSWVLVELADCMRLPHEREVTVRFIAALRQAPRTVVVPVSEAALWRGFELYRGRTDKEWSLTDCISFVVMKEQGLTHALTGDHHFEQAGFTALLK